MILFDRGENIVIDICALSVSLESHLLGKGYGFRLRQL
jgi:hypothetical protein